MDITSVRTPRVSAAFYNTLVKTFPKLDPSDVKENTSLIYIQRRAAQQEVIDFISASVRPDNEETKSNSLFLFFDAVKKRIKSWLKQ